MEGRMASPVGKFAVYCTVFFADEKSAAVFTDFGCLDIVKTLPLLALELLGTMDSFWNI